MIRPFGIRLYVIRRESQDDIDGDTYSVEAEIRTKRRDTDSRWVRPHAIVFLPKEVWETLKPGREYALALDTNEIIEETATVEEPEEPAGKAN
jgi:hypothetical protein